MFHECIGPRGPQGPLETESENVHIVNYNSSVAPCGDCYSDYHEKYPLCYRNNNDPEITGTCATCGHFEVPVFDQDGNSVCDNCSKRSLIKTWRHDNVCWQCETNPVANQCRLFELQLCELCKKNHTKYPGQEFTYRPDVAGHTCDNVCVRYFLSRLTSAFQHKLRSMTMLPTCVSDLVANYVGADLFGSRFYWMHEMFFLRPNDAHCVQHNSIPRGYRAPCKLKAPCLFTKSAAKKVYYCENPREIFLAYNTRSHVCDSTCAAIVLRVWQACLRN